MHKIGVRLFPDGALIVANEEENKIYFRQTPHGQLVLLQCTRNDGEYVLARDIRVLEPDTEQGLLPAEEAVLISQELIQRLRTQGITAKLGE